MRNSRKPFCDMSKTPPLSLEEKQILRRLIAGEELNIGRQYSGVKGCEGDIWNYFWWAYDEDQWDGPVWMLLRRGLVYPTGCAGGAQWIVVDKSKAVIKRMTKTACRP